MTQPSQSGTKHPGFRGDFSSTTLPNATRADMVLRKILSLPPAVARFIKTSHRDNVLFLASALSFDALLAAIPLALLFIALLGFFLQGRSPADIGSVLQVMLPAHEAGEGNPLGQAKNIIQTVIGSRSQLSLYGLPLFLLFSTRLFASVRIALNQVLLVHARRGFFRALGVDLILVIITTVLFAANSVVSYPVFDSSLIEQVAGHLLAVAFGIILFFMVYSIAPDEPIAWDTALIAATAVSIGFEIAKVLFSFYLANVATIDTLISHANAIAIILFVFWIYYSALLFLLGAEVAKVHRVYKRGRSRRESRAMRSIENGDQSLPNLQRD